MYNANQKVQRYSSTGDKTIGEAALESLKNSDEKFIDLAAQLSGKDKANIKSTRELEESKKKSLKDLDKLIERVIIEHMHK
jgi:ribosomal protein L30E